MFVAWRIELHDLERVKGVNLVNVLFQLVSGLGLYLLDLLEPALLNEGFLCCRVIRKGFGELMKHIVQDLCGTIFN